MRTVVHRHAGALAPARPRRGRSAPTPPRAARTSLDQRSGNCATSQNHSPIEYRPAKNSSPAWRANSGSMSAFMQIRFSGNAASSGVGGHVRVALPAQRDRLHRESASTGTCRRVERRDHLPRRLPRSQARSGSTRRRSRRTGIWLSGAGDSPTPASGVRRAGHACRWSTLVGARLRTPFAPVIDGPAAGSPAFRTPAPSAGAQPGLAPGDVGIGPPQVARVAGTGGRAHG